MKILDNQSKCVGCSLCSSFCPKNCIEMKQKTGGFLYPEINQNECIQCGKCKSICPVNKPKLKIQPFSCYALSDKDEDSRVKSASGGASNVFARHIVNNGGVFCGCRLDMGYGAIHDVTNNIDELDWYRDSKYVQSNMTHVWEKIDEIVNHGTTLLFIGTPCQAAAVRSKYGNKENLYICDFVCSGVPDPKIFKLYLSEIEKCEGKKIKNFYFRDKTDGWKKSAVRVVFDDKSEKRILRNESSYYKIFGSNLCMRNSCYNCDFKDFNVSSDLTIGDWWGIGDMYPELDDDKGCSLVIVNTQKGAKFLEEIHENVFLTQIPLDFAIKTHPKIEHSVSCNPYRNLFYKMFHGDIGSMNKAYERCIGDSIIDKIKRKVYFYTNLKHKERMGND